MKAKTVAVAAHPKQVFDFKDYKSCLQWLLDAASQHSKGQKTLLAAAMGCQPSYLSRVFGGLAHLSLEQVESAARHFVLSKPESAYFIALLGEERAGTQALKDYWRRQQKRALEERLELKNRVDLENPLTEEQKATYFSSWHMAAVHAAVAIESLQTISSIASYLRLSKTLVRSDLDFLCAHGLVKRVDGKFTIGNRALHLAKESPLVQKHHLNWKLRSMDALNQPKASDLHYCSLVALSRSDLEKLKERMLSAVEEIRGTVAASKEETLACYSLEIFELDRTSEGA